MQHEENWIALAQILGPRSAHLKPLLEAFQTPEKIFEADEDALRAVIPDIGAGLLRSLLTRRAAHEAREILLWCHRDGVRILPFDSAEYPAMLRELDEPPAVLYCRGKLPDFNTRAVVGVVGPRRADAYGEQVAYTLSFELAAAGVVILSGMAEGIDGVATAAAICAGGTPVAVLGCGIDVTYPRHHGKLMAECAERGAVITEFAPGTPPNGYNFPMRNRLISALSDEVLVVQAGAHSGALITARYALTQGRPLYAVPGNITSPLSEGTNRLLQSGAFPALGAIDLLAPLRARYHDTLCEKSFEEATQYAALDTEKLYRLGVRVTKNEKEPVGEGAEASPKKPRRERKKRSAKEKEAPPEKTESVPDTSALTPRQREIYDMLPRTPFTVDVLTERGIPVSEAASTLTLLEIYGLLGSRPGGTFELK
ncbi:MAG: DNA-protecting protein DprA [Ruminococcaceae bacterium]|nr:DNA-protecting protein DprA [Oscillospiraceae bacterium]